jgi:signal transduction histidine kinase
MRASGRVIGVAYIDSNRLPLGEQAVDLSLLEAFAAQTALAVDNARLREEARRKTELMSILAHEIRNPLGGILGYSDIGKSEDSASDSEAKELFGRVHRDAERLRRLVDNILELSRHEAGKIEWSFGPVDLGALIEEVVQGYRPTCAKKRVDLAIDTEGLDAVAAANADRLGQVLSNLLSNAVKFTPAGGRIAVSARCESVAASDPESPPAPASELDAWGPFDPADIAGRFVRVDVADTGPGMTEEVRSGLFEKFFQAGGKRASTGVGLGLYISREIVHRHGGTIWVTSTPGEGTTFSFRIPVTR